MTSSAPNRASIPAVLLLALAACVLMAAGCPSKTTPPPVTPDAKTDTKAQETPAKKPDEAPTSKEGITGKEPPPGSLKVEDVGPAAPTVFFLAGMNGYTEPCGCTLDILLGGVDRIAGFLTEARGLAKGDVLIDAGNLLFDAPKLEAHRVAQERAKADVLVQALTVMGAASTTPGPNDFALGKHFYLDKIRGAGLEILVANLKESEGLPLGVPHMIHDIGGVKVGFIGLVQPDLFVGIEGLTVTDTVPAAKTSVEALKKEGAQAIVAVHHGDLKSTKTLLTEVPEIHFAIVGHDPRESGQIDPVGQSFTLEAYNQGRHLGILKLYPQGRDKPTAWLNARQGSKADIERIDKRIGQVSSQLERIPPPRPGEETPAMMVRLRKQIEDLERERETITNATIELPKDKAAFVYRSELMRPGYKLDATLTAARDTFNEKLKELVPDEPIVPVAEGDAEYIGTERCARCHPLPMEIWSATSHSRAINTLIERNKSFDGNCIGCHVTGYRKPGGSVLGKLQYTARVGDEAFTKKLENVGCEVCHGPGSKHAQTPVDGSGKAQHITREAPETLCKNCHNEEHSPRFKYDTYLNHILGEGHQKAGATP